MLGMPYIWLVGEAENQKQTLPFYDIKFRDRNVNREQYDIVKQCRLCCPWSQRQGWRRLKINRFVTKIWQNQIVQRALSQECDLNGFCFVFNNWQDCRRAFVQYINPTRLSFMESRLLVFEVQDLIVLVSFAKRLLFQRD